mgnify:CR=1 FL=1
MFGSNSLALIVAYALKKSDQCEKVVVVAEEHLKDFIESFDGIFVLDDGEPTEVQKQLMAISTDGYDYTFECSNFQRWGTVALEICHKGFGRCCLLSRPQSGTEVIKTRPF